MGPPAYTCTVFRLNDLKTHESLSKVRHLSSVRMVRVIADRSGFGCGYWSKSLFREFITVLYDVQMKTLITLLFACCFGSAMAQSNLPTCEGDRAAWTNCFGSHTYASGNKYVGEYKDGKRNGQFIVTYANGNKYVGEFKDEKKNGRGIKFLANGKVDQSGIWKDGVLVQSKFIDVATFTGIPNLSNSASNQAQRRKPEEQAKQDQAENEALATALNSALAKAVRKQKELEAQLAAAQQQTQVKPTAPIGPRLSVHAIVIGNGAYQGSGQLDNPINDARAISAKLKSMGFKVTTIENADRTKLVSSLVKFSASAVDSDLTLFFYAGHGVQISGKNYMLPTDTNLNQIGGVELHGISLNSVVDRFLPGKTKLVFLDACRDNPLLQVASRSVSRGLAPISVSQGTLISYATKDGSVAADGSGKNSPFTKALLQHIDSPDDIAVVLRRVRDQVMRETGGQQQPWEYGSLSGGSLILSAIRAK